jgi:hypothetical protein
MGAMTACQPSLFAEQASVSLAELVAIDGQFDIYFI